MLLYLSWASHFVLHMYLDGVEKSFGDVSIYVLYYYRQELLQ